MKTDNLKQEKQCAIHDVMVRFLPLTWFVWLMWKLGFLKRDHDGCYRGDPETMRISRWVFRYIPIQGKTKKRTKFIGNWHWFRLMLWEVHILIKDKKPKIKSNNVSFP